MCVYFWCTPNENIPQEITIPLYVEIIKCENHNQNHVDFPNKSTTTITLISLIYNDSDHPIDHVNFLYPRCLGTPPRVATSPKILKEFYDREHKSYFEGLFHVEPLDERNPNVTFYLEKNPVRPFRKKKVCASFIKPKTDKSMTALPEWNECKHGIFSRENLNGGVVRDFTKIIGKSIYHFEFDTPLPQHSMGIFTMTLLFGKFRHELIKRKTFYSKECIASPYDIVWHTREKSVSYLRNINELGDKPYIIEAEKVVRNIVDAGVCSTTKQTCYEQGYIILTHPLDNLTSNLTEKGCVIRVGDFFSEEDSTMINKWEFGEVLFPSKRNILCSGNPGPLVSDDEYSRFCIWFNLIKSIN